VVGGGVETGVLPDGIQMWTRMWAFNRLSFYSTLCAVSHSSLLAVQNSPRADIVPELARIGRNSSFTPYYNLVRLDLRSGAVYSTIFTANVSSMQQHSRLTLRLDSEDHFVLLYDPLLRAALYTIHVQSWQTPAFPPQSPSAAGGGLCVHSNCLSSITRRQSAALASQQQHTSPHAWAARRTLSQMLSRTLVVQYGDLFQGRFVVFQDTNRLSFGVARLDYTSCPPGSFASSDTLYVCMCQSGWHRAHHPAEAALVSSSAACVRYAALDACYSSYAGEVGQNTSRCAPGYKMHRAACVLCGVNEYCQHSQGVPCQENSATFLVRGAFDSSACRCLPGYFLGLSAGTWVGDSVVDAADATSGACVKCSVPFYCMDSRQYACRQNMSTRVHGASSADHCQCASGFYEFFDNHDDNASVVDGNKDAPPLKICRQIPTGYYKPDAAEIPEKCPRSQTTLRAKSLSKTECICAPGFKREDPTADPMECVACGQDEMCAAATTQGLVEYCTQYKQTVNHRHDACVCVAGFYDEMRTKQGAGVRCLLCPAGYYCPLQQQNIAGKTVNLQTQVVIWCPHQMTSHPGTPSAAGCFCQQSDKKRMQKSVAPFDLVCVCANTHYESADNDNLCTQCPKHMFVPLLS